MEKNIDIVNYVKDVISIRKEFKCFKQETKDYHIDLEKLKDVIHDLDSNSYYYRFPTDRNGNPHNLKINTDILKNILKFREKVDAYLTFAIPVLQEYGYLESDYEYE